MLCWAYYRRKLTIITSRMRLYLKPNTSIGLQYQLPGVVANERLVAYFLKGYDMFLTCVNLKRIGFIYWVWRLVDIGSKFKILRTDQIHTHIKLLSQPHPYPFLWQPLFYLLISPFVANNINRIRTTVNFNVCLWQRFSNFLWGLPI